MFLAPEQTMIDDMESYRNEESLWIWAFWDDGLLDDNNGSIVGNGDDPETVVVFEGRQALPLTYDNATTAAISEATYTFDEPLDVTAGSPEFLSLHFRGAADNGAQPIYVRLTDTSGAEQVIRHENPQATLVTEYEPWLIAITGLTAVNPASIATIILYVDNIRVTRSYLTAGQVGFYPLEGDAQDRSGQGLDGTLVGDPVFVDGVQGQALEFDGTGAQYVDLGTANPSSVFGKLSLSLWARWNGLSGEWQGLIGKRDTWAPDRMMWQIEASRDTGVLNFARSGGPTVGSGGTVLAVGEWQHVGITFDGKGGKFFIDGEVVGSGLFSLGAGTDAALVFGCCQANGGSPFNGALDEVAIYDFGLSDEEMKKLATVE
jgi:hypothetical protein